MDGHLERELDDYIPNCAVSFNVAVALIGGLSEGLDFITGFPIEVGGSFHHDYDICRMFLC